MRRTSLATLLTTAVAVTALAVPQSGLAQPENGPEAVVTFDQPGHLPEGVDVDRRGNLYVSLGPPYFVVPPIGSDFERYGAVVKVRPDGTRHILAEFPDGPAPAGIVVDGVGRVYTAVPDPAGPDSGVYRVANGKAERIPGTEGMPLPNGLALGRDAALYASDSLLGQIWRIPARGRGWKNSGAGTEIWLDHELLRGCDPNNPDQALGANGIAFYKGDLFVANTTRGALIRVPVDRRGVPGEPTIVAGDASCDLDPLYGLDGIAVDAKGRVLAAVVLQNRLVRIDPDGGQVTDLLNASDGLWNPASIAFGKKGRERSTLYIANYAVLGPPSPLGPAVLGYEAQVPGWRFR